MSKKQMDAGTQLPLQTREKFPLPDWENGYSEPKPHPYLYSLPYLYWQKEISLIKFNIFECFF